MRLLVTGGTGVLGRAFLPLAEAEGHRVNAPGRAELDLFDPAAVAGQLGGVDAVLHLATRIQPLEKMGQPQAWRQNDRLRAEASAILVDAALAADVKAYIQPTVTFVYPDGQPATEETNVRDDVPVILRSALAVPSGIYNVCRDGERSAIAGSPRPPADDRGTKERDAGHLAPPRTPYTTTAAQDSTRSVYFRVMPAASSPHTFLSRSTQRRVSS